MYDIYNEKEESIYHGLPSDREMRFPVSFQFADSSFPASIYKIV